MTDETTKALIDQLKLIKIAIESVNPDPAQTIQEHRDLRAAQQRAADQLVTTTDALVSVTRRLSRATWGLVALTGVTAAIALLSFTGWRPARPSAPRLSEYQAMTGLGLNLVGAVILIWTPMTVLGAAVAGAYERLYSRSGQPRELVGAASIERSWHWWTGWSAMVAGYILQILSAFGWRLF